MTVRCTGVSPDRRSRSDLKKAFEIVKNRIEPIGIPLGLLPGNHDRWVPYRTGQNSALFSLGYDPGGKDFHRVFSSFWGPGDVRTFDFFKDTFRVAVIAADLSLRRAKDAETFRLVNKHGQGKAYKDIVDELEAKTLASPAMTTRRRLSFGQYTFLLILQISLTT